MAVGAGEGSAVIVLVRRRKKASSRSKQGSRYAYLIALSCVLAGNDVSRAGDPQRERGGYGNYDEPAEWPTLTMPDLAISAPLSESGLAAAELELKQAKAMLGREVVNQEGGVLGQARAIVLHKQDQSLRVVVALGERLGFGGRKVVMPLTALKPKSAEKDSPLVLVSDSSPEALQQLPVYQPALFDVIEPSWGSGA